MVNAYPLLLRLERPGNMDQLKSAGRGRAT